MQIHMKKPRASGRLTVLTLVLFFVLTLFATPVMTASASRAPNVPANLVVPDSNRVEFHAYATGVQIYVWNGTVWVFKAPEATLYDADGNVVGTHYAGPTWESNSGSKVVGQRIASVMVDSTAIPWLLLKAKSTAAPGIFTRTTYIQRVNTAGGLAPSAMDTTAGQEARVPYTAEYYFYRAHK